MFFPFFVLHMFVILSLAILMVAGWVEGKGKHIFIQFFMLFNLQFAFTSCLYTRQHRKVRRVSKVIGRHVMEMT